MSPEISPHKYHSNRRFNNKIEVIHLEGIVEFLNPDPLPDKNL